MTDEQILEIINNSGFPLQIGLVERIKKTADDHHCRVLYVEHRIEQHVVKLYAEVEIAARAAAPTGTSLTVFERLDDLKGVYIQWRYVYELERGPEVKVQPSIWVAQVLHAACVASRQI